MKWCLLNEMEEQEVIRLEYIWLLADEFPSVLNQLNSIIKACSKKFIFSSGGSGSAHNSKGSNFILSLPNSEAVRGLINISGDCVTKAELRFKITKLSNPVFGSFIFEQCPWKLQQLQDASNHLYMALDEISDQNICGTFTSGKEVIQLMDKLMYSLSRAKTCLIVPEKFAMNELMAINAQRVLNPPVPDELLITFHINCDKLVMLVYVHNILTAPPSQKLSHHDGHSIGYIYEHNGRWFEITNRIEIICTVPWLKDLIVWLNTAQQLCQQLKDKITIFQSLLPDSVIKTS